MRPLLSRGTFRAASRLLAANPTPNTPAFSAVAPRPPAAVPSRPCTSSAVSPDPSTKPASATPATSATSPPPATDPASPESLQPLDEHAHPLPPTETSDSAQTVTTSHTSQNSRAPSTADPAVLLEQLRELLARNAVRSALFHFSAALKAPNSPAVDASVLKLILPVLGRQGWGATSSDTLNLAFDRGYNLGSGLYNCALHAMSRSGDHESVASLIERMWALPPDSRPNATSYNYLIGTYMYRGNVDGAFDVLSSMKQHLIYPTFATYHSLITGCLRAHDPRRAYSTLSAVESQRFDVGAMTITQVLVACANADLVPEAVDLLTRAIEALPRYDAEVHRIAETRLAYRMARLQRTTTEERATIRGSPRVEVGALNAVLLCAYRNKHAGLAMSAWAALKDQYPGRPIEESMWYCLIGTLAGAGEFSRAIDAVATMRENGITPKIKDLEASLIRPLSADVNIVDEQYYRLCDRKNGVTARTKSANEAEGVVNDGNVISDNADDPSAKDISAEPSEENNAEKIVSQEVESEDSTATASEKDEESQEDAKSSNTSSEFAKLSLREVLSEKVEPQNDAAGWTDMTPTTVGLEELNSIIWACSIGRDLDRAFQTYDEVERTFGLERNIDTFNGLLEGCVELRHVRGGMRIMTEIENNGLPLTGETIHLIVRLLTRSARLDDAIEVVEKCIKDGGRVPLKTLSMMVRYLLRGDNVEQASQLVKLGEDHGYPERAILGRLDADGAHKLSGFRDGEAPSNTDAGSEISEAVNGSVDGDNESETGEKSR